MEARILGSGGWMPTDVRETTCIYFREDDDVLVVDAGTGFRRLVTEPELLDGVRRLSVVLTHFHVDHIMGLPFLGELEHVPQREIWGAGLSVEGIATEQLVRRLFDPPLTTASELPADIHELAPPGAQIGRFSVDVKPQLRHQNTTLAIKVNGEVVVCTDTEYDESNAEFAHGARVLCHDSFFPDTGGKGHTGAGEAAKLAVAASVQRLVLIHLNPLVGEEELLRVAREAFPATEVGRDGMML